MENCHLRVAVIGAGWAGAAAALTLTRHGKVHATVLESTRIVGGRARRVEHAEHRFDNGQHLLLGAYERCLSLIGSLHGDLAQVIQRLPLGLHSAPSLPHALHMSAPGLPAPFHLLAAIVTASGLTVSDKWATAMWANQALNPACDVDPKMTVAEWTRELPDPVQRLLWDPLCVAALNTAPSDASARVFAEVLRRAFTTRREASDLLVPLADLSALLPEPALAEVSARGGDVRHGAAVVAVTQDANGVNVRLRDHEERFDRVILATGPQHVGRLLEHERSTTSLTAQLAILNYEPITTVFFEFAWVSPLPSPDVPMLMLNGAPGQWLFWRQQPNGRWRASVVVSADHRESDEHVLIADVRAQLAASYRLPAAVWQQAVCEKRATYACTPAQHALLSALPHQVGRIHFAGDWCVPELPATLEAAVISGERAAAQAVKSS